MKEGWKTIHKTITINEATLNEYGEYVDFIHLKDDEISIRLIVKKDKKFEKRCPQCSKL